MNWTTTTLLATVVSLLGTGRIMVSIVMPGSLSESEVEQAIERAKAEVEELNNSGRQWRQAYTELSQAIDSISREDLEGDFSTLWQLKPLVRSLHEQGKQVVDAYHKAKGEGEKYEAALKKTIPRVRAIAKQLKRYAADLTFDDNATFCRLFAETLESEASRLEERAGNIQPALNVVDDSMVYIEETVQMLGRVSGYLDVFDHITAVGTNLETVIHDLRDFMQRFQMLRRAMSEYHNKLNKVQKKQTPM